MRRFDSSPSSEKGDAGEGGREGGKEDSRNGEKGGGREVREARKEGSLEAENTIVLRNRSPFAKLLVPSRCLLP